VDAAPVADPLATCHAVLVIARRAGLPFAAAWTLAAEAALAYRPERDAEQWWVLMATEGAWRDAYERRPSRLAALGV
jgi:hypothetical protein